MPLLNSRRFANVRPNERNAGLEHDVSVKINRSVYADTFGPTTGDRVRLADSGLIIEVEKDFSTYGEKVKFGGGKVIRDVIRKL